MEEKNNLDEFSSLFPSRQISTGIRNLSLLSLKFCNNNLATAQPHLLRMRELLLNHKIPHCSLEGWETFMMPYNNWQAFYKIIQIFNGLYLILGSRMSDPTIFLFIWSIILYIFFVSLLLFRIIMHVINFEYNWGYRTHETEK